MALGRFKDKGLFGPNRRDDGGWPLPERSCNAIAKMVQRLGLGSPAKRAIAQDAKKLFTSKFRQRLDSFIQEHSKVLPAREIAAVFGISSSTVRRRRAQLGIKVTWRDAVTMSTSTFCSSKVD